MSRKSSSSPEPKKKGLVPLAIMLVAALAIIGIIAASNKKPSPAAQKELEPQKIEGPVTFAKHVAPIIYKECAPCHRPGQSGPFDLLNYDDAKKHSKDIARVTAKRIMPPWLPEHGYGDFKAERRLTDFQIAAIQRWVEEGAVQGNSTDLPPAPQFASGWQLGEPDLVVQPEPFTLPADGKDIYYNFVVPIPTKENKYVAGVELLSGSRAVHHSFIMVDETRTARRLASKLTPPGFFGMEQPETVVMPGGQLLGWQPGKIPSLSSFGLAWNLRTNTDLVLQTHLNPSGKPELIQPKLGLHFTDQEPTNVAYRLRLTALTLDIPAGESNYVTEMSYVSPVDLQMVRVGGHAHYLCKEMQGFATLPSGEKKWLLWIKDWDFKWQGDYEYREPVFVPKGSKVTMRFTYDNSTNNIRNPFNPPRRTLWGLNTTDEMGELYFQTMPRNAGEAQTIAMDYSRYFAQVSQNFYEHRIRVNPADAQAHQLLGRSLASYGKMDLALTHLQEAIRLNPNDDKAYFDAGSIFLRQNRAQDAYNAFIAVVRLNPEDSQAYGSLGIICSRVGRIDEARQHLLNALRLNPDDALAAQYLQRLNAQR